MRILVVDDDARTRELLQKGLADSGHTCTLVGDGEQALKELSHADKEQELVLLDVMMPVMDGWETLRRLRARGVSTPVILLTARGELDERVQGLKLGADDYLIKPYAWSELLARIEAVGRRTQTVLHCGDLEIDLRERHVRIGKLRIELSPREFALLDHLAREPGKVVSRKRLLRDVWGIEFEPTTNVIDVTVSRLRRRLMSSREVRIVAVAGEGYRIELGPAADEVR